MVFGYMPPGGSNNDNTPLGKTGVSQNDLQNLIDRFEKLKLVNMAMWTFLKEKLGVSEDELIERYKEIDLIDGNADGKLKLNIKKCSRCGKTMNPKFEKCLYCGTIVSYGSIFEAI
ncbi:MAG: hypothetical protein JXR69_11515 [Candidatus Delongbacteria bacterium]|nr:hypothetical protein [Candidatus Delongbacteria bacterium]